MRLSRLFGRTLRQLPPRVDPWTALALRAAIARLVDNQVVLLPLGERVLARLATSLRSISPEAQAMILPPGFPEQELGRVLQAEIQSYRQLPVTLLARHAVRFSGLPKGLARPEWCTTLQWAVASASEDELLNFGRRWLESVEAWWSLIGLAPRRLEWQPGCPGWIQVVEAGPEELLACHGCGYAASQAAAQFERQPVPSEALEEMNLVSTPGADTIRDLAHMLSIPESKTIKAVFMTADDGRLVFAVLRGDLEISISKLVHATKCLSLRPAIEEEIRAWGAEPGYASPVGLKRVVDPVEQGLIIIGDPSIDQGTNFVAGANKPDFHFQGVNYPRDFSVDVIADIAAAREGDNCPECGKPLVANNGIYLGCWKPSPISIQYANEDGRDREGYVGLGTLLLEPILAALLSVHHDDQGIIWPARVAPYDVHIVEIRCSEEAVVVSQELEATGLSVLFDDRKVSPGVKFTDADLIGCPLRITVSRRSLKNGGVELSIRGKEDRQIIPLEGIGDIISTRITEIM